MDKWIEMMKAVPGSYDDFVRDTARWMDRDENIRKAILEQLQNKPTSDTDDITKVLWGCLGIGEPLVLVDDEETDIPNMNVGRTKAVAIG